MNDDSSPDPRAEKLSRRGGKHPILVLGPLPPPNGGARISFQLFFDYIHAREDIDLRFYNVPVRDAAEKNPPGPVNIWKTLAQLAKSLVHIRSVKRVILFSSPGSMSTWGLLVIAATRLAGVPISLRFFGGAPLAPVETGSSARQKFTRRLFRAADRIVVQTDTARKKMDVFTGQTTRRVGGYRPPFQATPVVSTKEAGTRFVFLGRATPEKGIDVLLRAWKRLPNESPAAKDWTLEICGTTTPAWQSEICATPGVIYRGNVPHHEISSILAGSRGLVFPTRYAEEGHSGSILEAFFAATPVVTSKLDGPAELIQAGRNGLLVDPEDVDALLRAIIDLGSDDRLFETLRRGSRESATEYDATIAVPRLSAELGFPEEGAPT